MEMHKMSPLAGMLWEELSALDYEDAEVTNENDYLGLGEENKRSEKKNFTTTGESNFFRQY